MKNRVVELLERGKPIVNKEPGNSMTPILLSKEPVILKPITTLEGIKKGDIVFAKIKGRYYTHLVHGVSEDKGILLGNNHGHVQGWTKKVYAKAYKIPKEYQTTNEKITEYFKEWMKENE